jgi:hypothetical protein
VLRIKRTTNEHIFWVFNRKSCRARAMSPFITPIKVETISFYNTYNHEYNENECIRKMYIHKIKLLMESTLGSTRFIISKILKGVSVRVLSALKNPENISRVLRRHRNSLINPGPVVFNSINIGELLTKTHKNEVFYQFGPENLRGLENNNEFVYSIRTQ